MDNLQLINSLLQEVDGKTVTLFVGRAAGGIGLVQAGTWETLLPFRFDRITPLPNGALAAFRGGQRTIYRAAWKNGRLRLLPIARAAQRPGGISLPA